MTYTPDAPFRLQQLSSPRRFPWPLLCGVLAGILIAVVGVGIYLQVRPETKSIDGVKAPNAECRSDFQDVSHPWITDGWWVGYVDGVVKEMVSSDAAALSAAGFKLSGIWLCPPKRDW